MSDEEKAKQQKAYNLQDDSADSLMNFEYFDEKIDMLQQREKQQQMNENNIKSKDSQS